MNYSSKGNKMTNDVQRDQSASSPLQEKTAPDITTTAASMPTDPPFISLPATKAPGKTVPTISMRVRTRVWCIHVSSFWLSYLVV